MGGSAGSGELGGERGVYSEVAVGGWGLCGVVGFDESVARDEGGEIDF